MEAKHTPGPWYQGTGEQQYCVYDKKCWINPDGSRGGETPNLVIVVSPADAVANARLVAAAPDLLEACQVFAEWLRREDVGFGGSRDTPEGEAAWSEWFHGNLDLCRRAQDLARAAIAKATGEATC